MAARALLGWRQINLSEAISAVGGKLSVTAITSFEKGGGIRESNAAKIVEAFEVAGVIIIAPGDVSKGGGAGVRFRDEPDASG